MSAFVYKDYSCKLKFKNSEFDVPLNEETAELISDIFGDKVLPSKFGGVDDINRFYNDVMDSIDKLLGEGAADTIMADFAHAGTLELMSVVNYIVTEWNKQYAAEVEEMKKTTPQGNRETRRTNRK
jgi:hypothetical protein